MNLQKAMNTLADVKLISCILPKGKAYELQKSLVEEKGIHSGSFHHSRGVGRSAGRRGFGEQQEREMFEVIVPAEQADELFEYMFFKTNMDQPHGGLIYMTAIPKSTVMTLPDLAPEKQ